LPLNLANCDATLPNGILTAPFALPPENSPGSLTSTKNAPCSIKFFKSAVCPPPNKFLNKLMIFIFNCEILNYFC